MMLERFSEVLGATRGRQNRFLDHFLRCFFRMRFGIDFSSISGDSDLEKSTKNIVLFNGFCELSQNRRFRNISENMVMLASFLEAKTMKKREQIMLKNVFFLNIDFQLLFSGLLRFEDDFGRPRTLQKS